MSQQSFEARLYAICRDAALLHGLPILRQSDLRSPLTLQAAANGNEFSRGVLSMVSEVVGVLAETPEGRKLFGDRFFEPRHEQVDGKAGRVPHD